MIFKNLFRLFFNLFFISAFFNISQAKNYQINPNKKIKISNANLLNAEKQGESSPLKSEYILDTGDTLKIEIFGLKQLSGIYTINSEGEITLPELKKIYIAGKTLNELNSYLTQNYSEFIFDPIITTTIIGYRPVSVFLSGEVRTPGLYTLKAQDFKDNIENTYLTKRNPNDLVLKSIIQPRVFDAIKVANGLNNYADLEKITITRKNSKTQGGGKIRTEVNLLELFESGDQSQNLRLYDRDSIYIPKAKKVVKEQILAINRSNLNPNQISVFITGNVQNPGILKLKRGASLNQAIASSGGKKILTGKVEFLRLNNDGTSIKKSFNFDDMASLNSYKNPILNEGDVINVRKSILRKTSELIGEFSSPILSGYGLYSIFN